jgi:hypothetical protein
LVGPCLFTKSMNQDGIKAKRIIKHSSFNPQR